MSGSDKAKTAVGVAAEYVEDVLGLTTQPSEFAADRSRSLFLDSLIVRQLRKSSVSPLLSKFPPYEGGYFLILDAE